MLKYVVYAYFSSGGLLHITKSHENEAGPARINALRTVHLQVYR